MSIQAEEIYVDGNIEDWEASLIFSEGSHRTYIRNEEGKIYVGIKAPRASYQYVPIIVNGITIFVKQKIVEHQTWINVDGLLFTGGDDTEFGVGAEVKISVSGSNLQVQKLDGSYQDISSQVTHARNNDGTFIELEIDKSLVLDEGDSEDITAWTSHEVTMDSFVSSNRSDDSPLLNHEEQFEIAGALGLISDEEIGLTDTSRDTTLAIGGAAHGFGGSISMGAAIDSYGIGGYFDTTGGDTAWGLSFNIGVFEGNIPDTDGITLSSDTSIGPIGVTYETPIIDGELLDPGAPGSGVTFHVGGVALDMPTAEMRRGFAGYAFQIKENVNQKPPQPTNNSNGGGNNSNNWSSVDETIQDEIDFYLDDSDEQEEDSSDWNDGDFTW